MGRAQRNISRVHVELLTVAARRVKFTIEVDVHINKPRHESRLL